MLDAVDGLDDGLERLGHQLDRIRRLETVGIDADVDHRDADLRLFLPRDYEERDQTQRDRREQEQRRQRRADGGARQAAGDPEVHGRTSRSPDLMTG